MVSSSEGIKTNISFQSKVITKKFRNNLKESRLQERKLEKINLSLSECIWQGLPNVFFLLYPPCSVPTKIVLLLLVIIETIKVVKLKNDAESLY